MKGRREKEKRGEGWAKLNSTTVLLTKIMPTVRWVGGGGISRFFVLVKTRSTYFVWDGYAVSFCILQLPGDSPASVPLIKALSRFHHQMPRGGLWRWGTLLKKNERSVWTCLRIHSIKFSKGPPVV